MKTYIGNTRYKILDANGRRMMMAVNVNSPIGDYIQDGLVFHLDCADCDLTQGVWIDKKGSVSFAMSNVTVDSLGGVVFNGKNSKGVASVGLNNSLDTSTIEVAIKVNSSRTQFVLDSGNKPNTIAYGFYNNNTKVIYSMIVSKPIANVPNILGNLLTNSIHSGSQNLNIVNGNIGTFNSDNNYWGSSQNYATIGIRNSNIQLFNGTIYQIRIYNRLLTADEMIHNQQIDMKKYNSN